MSTHVQEIIDKNPQKKGLAVIVTNDYERLPPEQYPHLPGCHIDGDEMDKTLVDKHKFARCRVKNLSAQQMSDLFAHTAQCSYPNSYKYVAVVFSGHGQKDALIGNDGVPVDVINKIVDPFEPSENPQNKHIIKLFFFDACRGEFDMQRAQPKGRLRPPPGPERGNYLIAYATTDRYVAWGTDSGSYWMVPLAEKLRDERDSVQNLLSKMTGYMRKNHEHLQAPVTIVACDMVKLFEDDVGDGAGSNTATPGPTPAVSSASSTSPIQDVPVGFSGSNTVATDDGGLAEDGNKASPITSHIRGGADSTTAMVNPVPDSSSGTFSKHHVAIDGYQSENADQLSIHSDIKMAWKKEFAIEENCISQTIDCEEFGLKIHVPKGATSSSCDIVIKAIVAGDFDFPKGTQLVSGVYAISVSKKFLKPVRLEMQHCVLIENKQHTQLLKFVRADDTEPHKFTTLEGGVFQPDSQYGNICCQDFSLFSIIMEWISGRSDGDSQDQPSLQYYAQFFYSPTAQNHWRVKFAVTKNIKVDIKQLKDELSEEHYEADCSHIVFEFANTGDQKTLTVDITTQEIQGWQIRIMIAPMALSEQVVLEDESIPSLDLEINAKEGTTESFYLGVPIQGIIPEKNLFIHRRFQAVQDRRPLNLSKAIMDAPDPAAFWGLDDELARKYTGKGVSLLVFDTGIATKLRCFASREVGRTLLFMNPCDDNDGHGSFCARISCGDRFEDTLNGKAFICRGVAPDATLAIWKGYEHGEGGVNEEHVQTSEWSSQLDKMVQQVGSSVDVVVISSEVSNNNAEKAINELHRKKVIVVCAAGNHGKKDKVNIQFPASLGEVICVGAHNQHGHQCSFSSQDVSKRKCDVLALGDNVIGLKLDGSLTKRSGTSIAAPAVGGLICLILQAVKEKCGEIDCAAIKNNNAMKLLLQELVTSPDVPVISRTELKSFFRDPMHYVDKLKSNGLIGQ